MYECVINISEGRRLDLINEIATAAGTALLDVHSDPIHHRSVLTIAGREVFNAAQAVARAAVELLDYSNHDGVHPRIGVLDVVPFVPVWPGKEGLDFDFGESIVMRNDFGAFLATELQIPCFFYGPERSLPDIRRHAFSGLAPDLGPLAPNPKSGACCVGARPPLVAYNVWLADADLEQARSIAQRLRAESFRTMAFDIGTHRQVSFNLISPWEVGPQQAFDRVRDFAAVDHAELVGLIPRFVLDAISPDRWHELDLSMDRTIEQRASEQRAGADS